MTRCSEESVRSSVDVTDVKNFNLDQSTASAVYSLLDAVDSESTADEFDIGTHSKTHNFARVAKSFRTRTALTATK